MNRRQFLLSSAGLAATGAFAADSVAFRAEPKDRGWYERMQLAMQLVEIGLPKPFSILHISDTHLTEVYPDEGGSLKVAESRARIFGGQQKDAFLESLKWGAESTDAIIHTGDLLDFQSKANLDFVQKTLAGKTNFLYAVGNHEYTGYRSGWDVQCGLQMLESTFGHDPSFSSHVLNGVNFVLVENVNGRFAEQQARRFKDEARKGLPIVLGLHVPVFTETLWKKVERFRLMGRKFRDAALPPPGGDYRRQLDDPLTRDFITYLRGERLLKCILAGHHHLFAEDRFSPTAMEYVVAGNYLFHGQEILFT